MSLRSSSVNSASSPIKRTINSSYLHESTRHSASKTRNLMVKDMTGCFIGPMPVTEFLNEYLPQTAPHAPRLPKLFNKIPKCSIEKNMYQPFIDLVTKHNLMPGLQIVNTSCNPDINSRKDKRIQPDLSIYDNHVDISENVMQYGELQAFMEFKSDELSDPFCDPSSPDMTSEELMEFQFEAATDKRKDCRGQIASYATEMLARQYRTRAFSIYIGDPCVRLICWDRSGAVVTEKFNFRQDSQPLVDFLWYFGRASESDRGRDMTVRDATRAETKLAVRHLSRWQNERKRPVVVFTVQDGSCAREFIAWGSMTDPESVTGRATRAYPVYEKATNKLYFLKDSWRAATLEKESDILRELNEKEVRNIPKFVCGDDIPGHTTLSHRFGVEDIVEEQEGKEGDAHPRVKSAPRILEKRRKSWKCGIHNIGERVHHRFVEDFIGHHLDKFTSSKQFMTVVLDAFLAHKDAYEKCNILHRDISAKNVMMTDAGRGILNDWDLAKRCSDDVGIRQHERTGTWQFISTLNLMDPTRLHSVQDDMESFVILVLYHGLRYMKHNAFDLRWIMAKVFDDSHVGPDGYTRGGEGKQALFMNRTYVNHTFEFTDNKPMTYWIGYAIEAVGEWLQYKIPRPKSGLQQKKNAPAPLEFDQLELRDYQQLMDCWEKVLTMPGWPSDDEAFDQCPKTSEGSTFSTLKRDNRSVNDEEGEAEDVPKKKKSKNDLVSSTSMTLRSSVSRKT